MATDDAATLAEGSIQVELTCAILAHLGGLAEVGVFVVPAILAIVALRWVEGKARRRAEEQDEESADVD